MVELCDAMCDNWSMKRVSNPLTNQAKAAAWERYEQAMVDADIESLPRSPEIEAMIAAWEAEGLDEATKIRLLEAYFKAQSPEADAAE